MRFLEFLIRLALSLWVGGAALFTFVLTPILFKTETRDTAARIVGNLFPAYFQWGLACGVITLISILVVRGRNLTVTVAILVLMLGATSFQAFYLEPKAAALKREIVSFETTPKDHPARKEFSKLHGISATCNIGVIGGGIILLALL